MSPEPGIVIVGAGPAGLAAARAYREAGGTASVTLVGAEAHLPYQRPPLTKEHLRGEMEPDELRIEDDSWFAAHRVEPVLCTRATALHPDEHLLELDGRDPLPYSSCLLATGSRPARLPVPGGDLPSVATMRTLEDSLRLRGHGPRAAVVGSGFIGCEAAASLAMRGAEVTLVSLESVPQEQRLGTEVGERIAAWLEESGVTLVMDAPVEAIEQAGGVLRVIAAGRGPLEVDTVLQAAGIEPYVELAEAAGLRLEAGAIAADEHLRTSAADVLVAGDVACARNSAAGRALRVEHWGEALEHGSTAGRVLAGQDAEWSSVPGFWSTIGRRTLKHGAWGDGYAGVRLERSADGAFTAWYTDERGACVGVLTHEHDDDYDRGSELVAAGDPPP